MNKKIAKKRLVYVGHHFHLKTRSTQFLVEALSTRFSVTTVAVDPENLAASNLGFTRAECDIVVVLQLDFLAPIFIARGIPTVVVPMFDGSEHMPELHWQFSQQARFVSFSRHLHVKIQRAGGQSLLVKYFPEPEAHVSARKYRELSGFFWERRPDSGVDASFIAKLVGSQLDRLHVHQARDLPLPPGPNVKTLFGDTEVTTSTWFENRSDLSELMARSNIYFAPRLSEGIGMGFLEAMAQGMAVIAHDASTHNEYIANWSSGVLYSLHGTRELVLSTQKVAEMGEAARQCIAEGRPVWLRQIDQMLDWIDGCPEPDVGDLPADFLDTEISRAYTAGFGAYRRFLRRNIHLLKALAPKMETVASGKGSVIDDSPALMPALRESTIGFGSADARQYMAKGWSHDEPGFVWVDGPYATLNFSAVGDLAAARSLTIRCHAPPLPHPQRLAIVVNGAFADAIEVGADSTEHTIALPEAGLGALTEIALFAEQTCKLPGEARRLSVAVSSISFH
ncbi:glycosyltransferase [Caulobacter sp. CCNWLY153]|jgi:hypothetical protein|uniref:Glycosyl transferase family 1 domain-containing protein n=1 Tax=Caulobacter radicis TaxID=2172650 RepID=A0A2T9J1Q4_9CAUL|nr:glycosyltransferase [Caulobacter radicis]PVM74014.1 hypothetical protein DDF65_20640 [Caulobacter radicis]